MFTLTSNGPKEREKGVKMPSTDGEASLREGATLSELLW